MLKVFTISTIIAAIPAVTYANSTVEELCTDLGNLTGLVALQRDLGLQYNDNYNHLISSGLDAGLADVIINLVYLDAADKSPEVTAGIMYISCIEASK